MQPFIHIDVEQLGEALAQLAPNARPLAGGTDLLPLIKEGLIAPERLINLKALAALRAIRVDEAGLSIGALTTLAELEQHPDVRRHWTALAEAAALSASPQLRNMATLGGNLLQQARCWYYRGDFHCWLKGGTHCHARDGRNDVHAIFEQSPCVAVYPSDPPVALLALDAEVQIVGAQGERRLSVAELLQAPSERRRALHTLADDELIVGVRVPRTGGRSHYLKAMDRAVWAYALVSVAVAAEIDQGAARNVRIVLGGVANSPLRATSAEALVEGRAIDAALAHQAGEAAIAAATPLTHNRYKLALTRNLVAQALLDLVAGGA
ncbi:FAD binding domain-containing protein [Kallotenue papyrolyticum]|uniref:FAD binding domain-containing protein n=1 Tax=Kallotenue papyrolyticum TaxID=1325125 RepID=UPI0004786226|nr:FAD binding domain-containing protein [Kallotenue papyrolyticum]